MFDETYRQKTDINNVGESSKKKFVNHDDKKSDLIFQRKSVTNIPGVTKKVQSLNEDYENNPDIFYRANLYQTHYVIVGPLSKIQ